MAKLSAKAATVTVDDSAGNPEAITTDVQNYTVDYTVGVVDVTGFTEPQNFVPDVRINKVTLSCLWNTAATTGSMTVLNGIVGSTSSKTLAIVPEGSGLGFSGEF